MSYLDWPRIHLGGFFTDPSTVNNDPDHYKADNTRPSPWQDPKGLHRFKFVDVKVQVARRSAVKWSAEVLRPVIEHVDLDQLGRGH